jgi:hypothetical protein
VGNKTIPKYIKSLINYVRGTGDKDSIYDSDSSIYHIQTKQPLGKTEITVDFKDDEDFLYSIGLGDEDIWILRAVLFSDDYEFFDSYYVTEDFQNGYIFYGDLNDENIEKLKYISTYLLPGYNFKLDDDNFREKLSSSLLSHYNNEIEYILDYWSGEANDSARFEAKTEIEKDINEFVEKNNFSIFSSFDKITTTITGIITWWVRLGRPDVDIKDLYEMVFNSTHNNQVGGWYEGGYSPYTSFDKESFNDNVSDIFDKIIDDIDTNEETKKLLDMSKRVTSKFNMDKWYKLPKSDKVSFKIVGFDKENLKITIVLQKEFQGIRTLDLSEENFNNLLYQPTLFKFDELY